MIFIAHQVGHKVSDAAAAPDVAVGGNPVRSFNHRRLRPYETFVMRMVMLRG